MPAGSEAPRLEDSRSRSQPTVKLPSGARVPCRAGSPTPRRPRRPASARGRASRCASRRRASPRRCRSDPGLVVADMTAVSAPGWRAASSTERHLLLIRLRGVELALKAEVPRAEQDDRQDRGDARRPTTSAAAERRPIGPARRPRPGRQRHPSGLAARKRRPAARSASAPTRLEVRRCGGHDPVPQSRGRRLHRRQAAPSSDRHDATELGELGMRLGARRRGARGRHPSPGSVRAPRTNEAARSRTSSQVRPPGWPPGRRASVMATAPPASRAGRAASGSSRSRAAFPSARRSRPASARRSRRARCASRWTSVSDASAARTSSASRFDDTSRPDVGQAQRRRRRIVPLRQVDRGPPPTYGVDRAMVDDR